MTSALPPFFRWILALALALAWQPLQAAPTEATKPEQVAIVYSADNEESQALAFRYARARGIPPANLIGLSLPDTDLITRTVYESTIRQPLVEHFDRESWWFRNKDAQGIKVPVRNQIRVLLLMKGVPYRIKPEPRPTGDDGKPIAPPVGKQDESSVDSELVYLGFSEYDPAGPRRNLYFEKELSLNDPSLTSQLFTCRIDGPSYEACQRIIDDSIEVEQTGLWGTCYLDLALKGKNYEQGDQWLRDIAQFHRRAGIPTIVEESRDTFPTNYPMTDAAIYYGWYTTNANGPLLNPRFKFKKGAIAVHLHSFSATAIHDVKKKWVGPILNKGAAATVGNVWEPYLSGSHHFDILQNRLLKGYSLVEAAHMAMPYHSWQSIVIGDPLYRPFLAQNQSSTASEDNKEYRAFKLSIDQWGSDLETLTVKIRSAGARMASGRLYEAMGLRFLEENKTEEAKQFFLSAAKVYHGAPDKLRQSLHRIAIHRNAGEKEAALQVIAEAQQRFPDIPEAKALIGLKNILSPPAPPKATPRKATPKATGKPQ